MLSFLTRAAIAQLLIGEAILTSYVIAFRLLAREPTALRWVGVVVCGALLSAIGFHLLSAVGAFHLLGATVSLTVVTAAVLRWGTADGTLSRWIARDVRFLGKLHRRYH